MHLFVKLCFRKSDLWLTSVLFFSILVQFNDFGCLIDTRLVGAMGRTVVLVDGSLTSKEDPGNQAVIQGVSKISEGDVLYVTVDLAVAVGTQNVLFLPPPCNDDLLERLKLVVIIFLVQPHDLGQVTQYLLLDVVVREVFDVSKSKSGKVNASMPKSLVLWLYLKKLLNLLNDNQPSVLSILNSTHLHGIEEVKSKITESIESCHC